MDQFNKKSMKLHMKTQINDFRSSTYTTLKPFTKVKEIIKPYSN